MNAISRVSIRPGVSILSVLPHLNYKPWYALAEFVDNALQSYLACRKDLRELEGSKFPLSVDIDIDPAAERITIRDNAGGIGPDAFPRAFRPAEVPHDASGLSEFGMGMKSAAAWFSPKWSVRTSALGENIERIVSFDIERIVRDTIEELEVETRTVDREFHYTEIVLDQVRKMPQSKTTAKIRDHLASIYRCFTRRGDLELRLNGELLLHEEPEILVAPYWKDKSGSPKTWRKEFSIDLSGGRRADGFVAIRARGSTARAGFALMRRNRLIEGSADETYRPAEIFGAANSFAYQRIFGEINLVGFKVSHTKDGIRWDEAEEEFVTKLKTVLASKPMPILDQVHNWRSMEAARESRPAAQKAVAKMHVEIEPKSLGEKISKIQDVIAKAPKSSEAPQKILRAKEDDVSQRFEFDVGGSKWQVELALDYKDPTCDWLRISDHAMQTVGEVRRLGLRIAMLHPFTQRYFSGCDDVQIQGLARLAMALVLSETLARDGGARLAGRVRTSMNELLRVNFAG
ncbi:ATP-binding protein [Methylobacterium sp. CM6257]